MADNLDAASTCFRLPFGPPLAETDTMPVPASFKDNSIRLELDSKVRAEQSPRRKPIAKFDTANGWPLVSCIEFKTGNGSQTRFGRLMNGADRSGFLTVAGRAECSFFKVFSSQLCLPAIVG